MINKDSFEVINGKNENNDFGNFVEENQFRMLAYELIKNGFSYPNKDKYKEIENTALKNILKDDELMSFVGDIPPLSQLDVLYTTYFDVVFNEKGCHLREGEYLKNKMSVSKLLLECKGFYKNFGLYLAPNELPDTLEIELEFMYYLSYLIIKEFSSKGEDSIKKIESILNAQKDFLQRHIIPFMSSVNECLKEYEELSFYYKLSSFANEFLQLDKDFVESSIEKISKLKNEKTS